MTIKLTLRFVFSSIGCGEGGFVGGQSGRGCGRQNVDMLETDAFYVLDFNIFSILAG